MILIFIFIISVLLYGSYLIGPFSLRVYMTIIMCGYILYKLYVKKNRLTLSYTYIYIYILFLLLTFFAKVFAGPFEIDGFFKDLLALHFVAIVSYCSVDLIVQNKKNIDDVLMLLIVIGLLNSVVSILQYSGHPLGMNIIHLFSNQSGNYWEKFVGFADRNSEQQLGLFIVPGIFGHGAINGGMNATLSILSLYRFFDNRYKYKWIYLCIFIIGFIGSYIIQERSPMGLMILFLFIGVWKYMNRKSLITTLILFSPLMLYFNSLINVDADKLGRFSEMGNFNSERHILFNNAINFISENWLWGGEYSYHQLYVTPHNFILHAFIYSGILGAVVVILLFILIIKYIYKVLLNPKVSVSSFSLACSLSIYLLNGLTHSGSLVSGDTIIWILCALMLRNIQHDYENTLLFQRAKYSHVSMAKSSYL